MCRNAERCSDRLRNAERAQRKREQARGPDLQDAADTERKELEGLASRIEEPEYSAFLRGRVRERIERSGYGADSVLLELVQNADDALAQAAEIARGCLPSRPRAALSYGSMRSMAQPTMDLKHFGRLINDTGGAEFPGGEDRQWDQDLYFMMLMDSERQAGRSPWAGRRSVNNRPLRPRVQVGPPDLRSAVGRQRVPLLLDRWAASCPRKSIVRTIGTCFRSAGHRVTRIRLPLRSDGTVDDLIARIFRRFHYTRTLLPAFARQLQEIVVDGGPVRRGQRFRRANQSPTRGGGPSPEQ